jgi:iron complex transport system permease protein
VGLTLLIAHFFKSDSTAILVLSGVIVSGLMRSLLGLLKYVMDSETQLPTIVYWELGSLADVTMKKIAMISPLMLISLVILLVMRWQFNLLSLGDNEAKSLGVNVRVVRGVTVVCSTLLTSSAVCLSGTIAWVGLIIPHVGRMFVGPDNVKLTPVVVFMGAIFLILIDTLARSISGFEIPLSILTGCIGAPLCIAFIKRQRMRVL